MMSRVKQVKTWALAAAMLATYSLNAQVTRQPIEDAQVYRGNVSNNYGTDVKLQVKRTEGSNATRNVYLKFDLAGITAAQVGTAKLRLYCNNKAYDTAQSVVGVFGSPNSWTEAAITWNTAPQFTGILSSIVVYGKLNYYEWDVSEYIRQSLASGTVVSLGVADLNFSDNLLEFSSKEAVSKPELVITADVAPVRTAYYLDAIDGNDNNDGASPATAWKTLAKINSTYLTPGTSVYLKSGQTFNGLFNLTQSGTAATPVKLEPYGGTAPAIINAMGQPNALFAYNRQYLEIKNLLVKNYRFAAPNPDITFNGVMLVNENAGVLNHFLFDDVTVDSVNSSSDVDNGRTVYNGGLRFYTTGSAVPSYFNDVQITNCTFQNIGRTGCNFRSDWELRNLNTSFGQQLGDGRTDNWVPNTNVVIRDNTFRKIAGNGLIVRVANKALIEGNFFDSCGTDISGNAVFNFNTDSTIYQFNEAQNTVYNNGDTDARGIDSDYRTKHTVIQYNYLHNNGFGGVVATGGDQTSGQIPQRFNIGTVIRYNLVENNDRQGISFSGAIDGLDVYNNTIYADATHNDVLIVRSAVWAVAPKNLRFKNNIFYFLGNNLSYSFASGSTYNFTNNLFYGNRPASEPADAAKITGDPKLVSPGNNGDGYKYLTGSAALNSGVLIPNNGGRDYYGLPVSSTTPPNVGMYNGPAVSEPVPVRLVGFIAKRAGAKTQLSWTTATEENSGRFEVERSADGAWFQQIGTVEAAGTSVRTIAYSFTDEQPLKGVNFYRLKQIDKDGSYTWSEVRMVNFNEDRVVTVFPNPANDKITVNTETIATAVLIDILDMQGRKVKSINASSASGVEVNVSALPRGIYSVQVLHPISNELVGKSRFLKL